MNPPLNPTLVVDGAGIDKLGSFLSRVDIYGYDSETNITDTFVDRKIRTLQFGDRNEQYVVDLLALADGNTQKLIEAQGDRGLRAASCFNHLLRVVRPSLSSKSHLKVGQNIEFDTIQSWWSLGLPIWNVYCTLLAEKCIHAGRVSFYAKNFWALDDMVARYCHLLISKDEQKGFDLENPLTQKQIDYAALDSRLVLAVRTGQLPKLIKDELMRAAQIEFDAVPAFAFQHVNGILLDREKWSKLCAENMAEYRAAINKLDEFFVPLVGKKANVEHDLVRLEAEWKDTPDKTPEDKAVRKERRQAFMAARKEMTENRKLMTTYEGEAAINYGSNPQLLAALHKIKGINGRNVPNTSDDTLKKQASSDAVVKVLKKNGWNYDALTDEQKEKAAKFPVFDCLREYRSIQKLIDTYGLNWLEFINPITGRVHSRFMQYGAETGRTSSTKPNIQNLPKDKRYRSAFVSRPGYRMATVDMSGAELRIIANNALAKSWLDAFNNGWDVHSVGTEILYPAEWPSIGLPDCAYFHKDHAKCKCPAHLELRDGTKCCNFLLAYGGGPRKLAENIGKTFEEACELMNRHRAAFPDVWKYLERSGQQAKLEMEARDNVGRRRIFIRPSYEVARDRLIEKFKDEGKDRLPTSDEIRKQMAVMFGSIEREGKNMPIQSTNASLAKRAMGCGFDKDGKPYLWHSFLEHGIEQVNFVHDEIVAEFPETLDDNFVVNLISDAYRRAGAEMLEHVVMESEGHVDQFWAK